jgi:hypothetical protein
MDTNTIGHLISAPGRITAAQIDGAVRHILVHLQTLLSADTAVALLESRERYDQVVREAQEAGEDYEVAYIRLLMEALEENFEVEAWEFLVQVEGKSAAEIRDLVQAIARFVERPDAPDTIYRWDPGNPDRRIIFAGETIWGEDPVGPGYQMLHAAVALGIDTIFDLR